MGKIAIIAHETQFTMDLITEIQQQNNTVFFVPMRKNISKDGVLPEAPKGLKTYRDKNKYKKLVSKSPELIFCFSLHDEFVEHLIATTTSKYYIMPKVIVLLSQTALTNYQNLSRRYKSKLSGIKFISFWNSVLKEIDGEFGLGESLGKVFSVLNIIKNNKIIVNGYGMTGKGIVKFLSKAGYHDLAINDIDPVKRVMAQNMGFKTGSIKELANDADVLVDATGDYTNYLNREYLDSFNNKHVTIISTSTKLGTNKPNGYKNKNGTVFSIIGDGMSNMSYEIGGNSHHYMRVTGMTVLYICLKYNKIVDNIDKYTSPYKSGDCTNKKNSLYIFSDFLEKQVAKYILRNNIKFGEPVKQYYGSNYLYESELKSNIVGKLGVQQSSNSENRLYKIYYNSDFDCHGRLSFKMDTIQNGSIIGTTTGTYKIIKSLDYGYGLIEIKYTSIYESPNPESVFNRSNPNSIFKTMKDTIGPFTQIQKSGERSVTLEYKYSNGLFASFITLYSR
jgi:hypothetical protein